jgi:hypothetical protein
MTKFIWAVLFCIAVGYAADDGLLTNEAGEHVELGTTALGEIRWILVDDDGKLLIDSEDTLSVVTATAPALDWAMEADTVGVAGGTFTFANTPVELHIQNVHDTQKAYVSFNGSDYFTVFPHASFSFSNYGAADIEVKGEGADTIIEFVYSY